MCREQALLAAQNGLWVRPINWAVGYVFWNGLSLRMIINQGTDRPYDGDEQEWVIYI